MNWTLRHGDLFDVLPTLAANSVDSCVTDPPYGLGFMGKQWDTFKPGEAEKRVVVNSEIASDNPNLRGRTRGPASSPSAVEYDRSLRGQHEFQAWSELWAREVFRVLKPGAHVLVCGAPRSSHRMVSGIEDAGFEIRDCIAWLFGQGFPKSLNFDDDWGTALKPAHEPIVLARKPFKGSVEANREKHGTGAINVNGCRIGTDDTRRVKEGGRGQFPHEDDAWTPKTVEVGSEFGRWPANVVLDEEAAAMLDAIAPFTGAAGSKDNTGTPHGFADGRTSLRDDNWGDPLDERSGASRFFYVAKPSRSEREQGCYDVPQRQRDDSRKEGNPGGDNPRNRGLQLRGNHHPTVKPIELMRYLVRLITPVGGTVIDPFAGSGTTLMAALYEGFDCIGIEREAEYVEIARRRIHSVAPLLASEVVA